MSCGGLISSRHEMTNSDFSVWGLSSQADWLRLAGKLGVLRDTEQGSSVNV